MTRWALVADIGGGTSDFSIVRVSPERARRPDRKADILACTGVHIGGTDFDRLLSMSTLMPHLGFRSKLKTKNMNPPSWYYHDLSTWQRINVLYDPAVITDIRRVRRDAVEPEKLDRLLGVLERKMGHALLTAVEDCKIELSTTKRVEMDLDALAGIEPIAVTRRQFESAIADQVGRIRSTIQETLRQSAITADAIGSVFVTGGSSRLPVLISLFRQEFAGARILEGDAFGSVATGLALDAHTRFGAARGKRRATR